jgi:hypothetical protein
MASAVRFVGTILIFNGLALTVWTAQGDEPAFWMQIIFMIKFGFIRA